MDTRFLHNNSHLDETKHFPESDPTLRALKSFKYIYHFSLLKQLPLNTPGIFTMHGPHLVGKTTLLKMWMENLLKARVPQNNLAFLSGSHISDYHALQRVIQKQLGSMPHTEINYLIIDDVIEIRDWEKAIQPLANTGALKNVVLMLAGAEASLALDAKKHLAEFTSLLQSFHLEPLSFKEAVILKNGNTEDPQILMNEFNQYLIHGGYLIAINDIAKYGHLQDSTVRAFSESIKNHIVKKGKQERYLREILNSIMRHFNKPVTWNELAQELSIEHPKTIGDYFALLEAMDVVFVQYALTETTLQIAPKKARKIMFADPFIFQALRAWLTNTKNSRETQTDILKNSALSTDLVKACVTTQFQRYFPTYYIKAEGEIDLAYVAENRFWPIEISWMSQLRAKDLKQILKYSNSRILTKTERSGIIEHIKTEPLALALWYLENSKLGE